VLAGGEHGPGRHIPGGGNAPANTITTIATAIRPTAAVTEIFSQRGSPGCLSFGEDGSLIATSVSGR